MTGAVPALPSETTTSTDTVQPCTCRQRAERAEAQLAAHTAAQKVRAAQIRQQVRDGVAAGNFDLDVSNHLLVVFGLAPLRREWTVGLTVVMTLSVAADDRDDAFDTARDFVEALLDQAESVTGHVDSTGRAIPGGLADESDDGPPAEAASATNRA